MTDAAACAQFPSNTLIQDIFFNSYASFKFPQDQILTILSASLERAQVR